jgi:hypothetical protein
VQQTGGHADDCPHRGTSPQPVAIATAARVEVLRLLVPVPRAPQPERYLSWGLSLGYALLNGMQHHGMLDTSELECELEGPWDTDALGTPAATLSLAFIDPSLGGSGYLERLAEQFHLVAGRAIEHLDHPNCETACYRCLKVYQNQRYHEQLAWPQTLPTLEGLAQTPPARRPLDTGDLDDPRPWLEAYAAGVGSPLELAFLRLFEQHDFHPQQQVPVAPRDGERPTSVADFAVPERRLAIYIDSAAFHVGAHLRRDRFIRDRLRQGTPPWRVEELRAADLRHGAALVARLQARVPSPPLSDTAPIREDLRGNTENARDLRPAVFGSEATPCPDTSMAMERAWADILALLEPAWQPLARGVCAAGLPAPVDAYWDLMDNGRVTGQQALLVWEGATARVALVPAGGQVSAAGMHLLAVTPTSPVQDIVTFLRRHLGGVA